MNQPVTESAQGGFCGSFARSRQTFLAAVDGLPKGLLQHQQSFVHPLTGPSGEPLYCDTILLGQRDNPKHLLVLISATHGVEGFAGSAIQTNLLPTLADALGSMPDLGVLIIHGLNPWGFAWLRRCDHEGIDLNRNFVDFNQPLPVNPAYVRTGSKLCHPEQLDVAAFAATCVRDGKTGEVTRGQYDCPNGCFYGGRGPSWSRGVLETLSNQACLQQAGRVAVVDLHTGLGPFGHGELINDHDPGSAGDVFAREWFGGEAKSAPAGESVSEPKIGLLDFHWHRLLGNRGCFVTLEFGTYSEERLMYVLLQEQSYHIQQQQSGRKRTLDRPEVVALKEFFCPADPNWQAKVLARGNEVALMAIRGMQNG